MQTSNRFFDDLAKVASGAASTVVGVKQELDAMVRQRIERLVADFDLVRRDEFEAVQAMAANARAEQERLERRLSELEAKIARGVDAATASRNRVPRLAEREFRPSITAKAGCRASTMRRHSVRAPCAVFTLLAT